MLAYEISACEVCIIYRKPTETLKIHCQSPSRGLLEASNGHTKDTTRLFHGPWHDAVGEHICAQPFRMWNRLRSIRFLQVSQIFQRRKSDANKQDFEKKLNLTCQAQTTPKTIGILTKVFCTSGPNLMVLARTGDELSHGLAQNGVNFDFEVKFDLEGQDQSLPKTTGILTKVFYIYGPNLVILAERGDELSRGQARDWRTDGHTDRQTQATTIPEGQNWPRVKTQVSFGPNVLHNYPIVDIMDEWDFARFDLSLRHTHTYHHIIPTPWIATQITPKGVYTIYHLINCGLETPYGNINMGQHCHCLSHCSHARESNFTKWFSCIFTWEQLQTNCFWPYYLTCVRRLYF